MELEETEPKVYKLRRFTSSSDKDFIKALRIYMDNTDHNIITNTNEISQGIDIYNSKFKDADFTAVGLYFNRVLIGYCQFVYFKDERLVFIDYLVIDKPYRKNNTFYHFIEEIKEYFQTKNYNPFFLIAEVSLQGAKNESEYSNKTRSLIRLLKMANFGVINSTYIQPMLGASNYESNLEALLMLFPADEHREIKKESFLVILKTIYFKHYQRWYSMIITDEKTFSEYSIHIHEVFTTVNMKLKNITSITLDSYSDVISDRTVSKPPPTQKKILFVILGFIGLIALLGILVFFLKKILGMEYKDQGYFLMVALILYIALLSIISTKAAALLNKAIEKLVDKVT